MNLTPKISVCLVVHNEAAVIERCLQSVVGLADEIIVAHDGPCADSTLEIASKYTDKIFVRNFVGEAEPHRVFTFEQATGDWIIQLDADEFFSSTDHFVIRELTKVKDKDAFYFKWELWDGYNVVTFPGLQKICLFRRKAVAYIGVPHAAVVALPDRLGWTSIVLHHRPTYNNLAWNSFFKKMKRWAPVHARYFFPETAIESFGGTVDTWRKDCELVRRAPIRSLLWLPLKNFLGQLMNGLWRSRYGWQVALQQYVYYVYVYWCVLRITRLATKNV